MMQTCINQISHTLCCLLLCGVAMFVCSNAAVAEQSEIRAEIRYLNVQPGQTLHNIVRRLYPGQESRWPQIRQEIVRLNPTSFVNADEASMKAGARLTLPGKDTRKRSLKRVGDVVQVQGQALAIGTDKISRQLVVGDGVYVGDKLVTGEAGYLRLAMIDNAKLDLRCFTIMVIEEYALKNTDRRSILKLLQGSLRKITGDIGKESDDVYELQTPVASVGVRGTEYALRVFQSKGCGGTIDTDDDGLFLEVIKGLVDVKNTAGVTVVAKGDQLYIPLPGAAPVKKVIAPGVIEPVTENSSDAEVSGWWYVLGFILIAIAL